MVVRIVGAGAVGAVVAEKLSYAADTAFIIDEERAERYASGVMLNGKNLDIPFLTAAYSLSRTSHWKARWKKPSLLPVRILF